jgi:uncharacterized cupredoxin-like copper-binding protein
MTTQKIARLFAAAGIAFGTALTGLLGLSSIALADGPQQITLNAADLSFSPTNVQMMVGQPVQLTITNLGQLDHDIKSDIPISQLTYVQADNDPQEQVDNAAQNVLDVDFNKGDTATITFVPTAAGAYSFECGQPGHASAGMKGMFVVADGNSGS